MMMIACLNVSLEGMEPKVTRRLEVPCDLRLDRLHQTLQAAFGWDDSHLWEMIVGGSGWGIPDPEWPDGPLDGRKTTLAEVIEETGAKILNYLYDFGDDWEHRIEIGNIVEGDPETDFPLLLDGAGRCPPEDVGGPWGYCDFLEAIADPDHEDHAHWSEWAPDGFDANEAHLKVLQADVAKLAKKWKSKRKK